MGLSSFVGTVDLYDCLIDCTPLEASAGSSDHIHYLGYRYPHHMTLPACLPANNRSQPFLYTKVVGYISATGLLPEPIPLTSSHSGAGP